MSNPYGGQGYGYGSSTNNAYSYPQGDPYSAQSQEWGAYPNRQDNLYPPHQQQQSISTDSLASNDAAPLGKYGAAQSGYDAAPTMGYGTGTGELLQREKNNPNSREATKQSHVMRWVIGGIILLALIGAGVGIGIWRSNANKSSSSSSNSTTSTGTGLQYISGTAKAVKSNPSDPSQFSTDTRFHQSFYGMTYTPFLAQEPWCGATLANITEDIQILSQLTTRLRTYGSACNITQFILDAIDKTKVNMTVYLGSYVGSNETVNAEQLQWQIDALKLFGTSHVDGIIIGNEYILDAVSKTTAVTYITGKIADAKTKMSAAGFGSVPVGTGDAGSEITLKLCQGSDFVMANDHAFFGGVPVAQAGGWTWDFWNNNDNNFATQAGINAYIGETGWPTNSMTAANLTYGAAVAGTSQLQTFLDTYPCAANSNSSAYYWFSPFDEPWKEQFGGVEPYWGLFDSNFTQSRDLVQSSLYSRAFVLIERRRVMGSIEPPTALSDDEAKSQPFKVHITGFGPFINYPQNPSWLAVRPLNGTMMDSPPAPFLKHGLPPVLKTSIATVDIEQLHDPIRLKKKREIMISTEEVPVVYSDVRKAVQRIHGEEREEVDLVLHVGVGASGACKLEQRGRRWGYEKLDYEGLKADLSEDGKRRGWVGDWEEVVGCGQEGEEEVRTFVDGDKVLDWLELMGIKCVKKSEDAGLYLCEYINFGSIASSRKKALKDKNQEVPVQFFHVPPIGLPYSVEELTLIIKHVVWSIVNEGGLD